MNLAGQVEAHLPRPLLELIQDISRQAAKQGLAAYLVGGLVRDLLLEAPALRSGQGFDVDLVVEGDAVKLAKQVARTTQAKLVAHHRFGTAKLRYENFTLDMAMARKETYARPGALPTVSPGTLRDDLLRRDFSINAMAISLQPHNYGELIDPHQGRSDLERRLVRILHPNSFRDDATRILRAVRYEQRLGFGLEPQTAELLQRDIPMLDTISGDRIRHELELILKEARPELVIRRLAELGALFRINSFLKGDGWIAEKFDKARRVKKQNQLSLLYFCLLIYSLGEKEIEQLLARLNAPTKLGRAMRDTVHLKARLAFLDRPDVKPSEVYYFLREYEPVAIQTNALATDFSVVHAHLELFLTKLRYVRPSLGGDELARLGISPGPRMGEVLEILHRAKLDGEVRTKADEEKLALSLSGRPEG